MAVGWAGTWVWGVATVMEVVVVRRGARGDKEVRRAAEAVARGTSCKIRATYECRCPVVGPAQDLRSIRRDLYDT